MSLWVPEVGGRVDPDSEAHDLVMSLFGGMSKGERSRIRTRTRMAMQELAANTDRFLGGRPPYGYRLADMGPHPNPSKAAAGQRAHRLEPDPVTAPVVARIFALYFSGQGYRGIAELLTREGVPSPAQHDPARNPHRDPRGSSHSAVKSILANPTYSGVRVWGKQEKHESLMDVNDVAAGTQVRMRWRDTEQWIRPERRTHEPLVGDDVIAQVQQRLSTPQRVQRKPRTSARVYPLRGLLFCAACGLRMQGTAFAGKGGKERVQYRCEVRRRRALPDDCPHPNTVAVSAPKVEAALDAFLSEKLADLSWVGAAQEPEEVPAGLLEARGSCGISRAAWRRSWPRSRPPTTYRCSW